jgi:2-deoxy-D-gluconate 3-dehydrogenase
VSVLNLFKLDGKTALVTGCKRGIGKAMALALAEAGADIAGVSKTLEPEGSAVGREVAALGRKFKAGRFSGNRHTGEQRRHDPSQAGCRAPG